MKCCFQNTECSAGCAGHVRSLGFESACSCVRRGAGPRRGRGTSGPGSGVAGACGGAALLRAAPVLRRLLSCVGSSSSHRVRCGRRSPVWAAVRLPLWRGSLAYRNPGRRSWHPAVGPAAASCGAAGLGSAAGRGGQGGRPCPAPGTRGRVSPRELPSQREGAYPGRARSSAHVGLLPPGGHRRPAPRNSRAVAAAAAGRFRHRPPRAAAACRSSCAQPRHTPALSAPPGGGTRMRRRREAAEGLAGSALARGARSRPRGSLRAASPDPERAPRCRAGHAGSARAEDETAEATLWVSGTAESSAPLKVAPGRSWGARGSEGPQTSESTKKKETSETKSKSPKPKMPKILLWIKYKLATPLLKTQLIYVQTDRFSTSASQPGAGQHLPSAWPLVFF